MYKSSLWLDLPEYKKLYFMHNEKTLLVTWVNYVRYVYYC